MRQRALTFSFIFRLTKEKLYLLKTSKLEFFKSLQYSLKVQLENQCVGVKCTFLFNLNTSILVEGGEKGVESDRISIISLHPAISGSIRLACGPDRGV